MPSLIYLLDTNILSDLIKFPHGQVAQKIKTLQDDVCCTSIIVACELRYGALKKDSPKLTKRVDQILETIDIIPFQDKVTSSYASIRTDLEKRGTPIGGNDLLIAAHALTLQLVIVTANEKEFTRVNGLKVENWLRKP